MEIKALKIYSYNLDAQEHFYKNILGFQTTRVSDSLLHIHTQESTLMLELSNQKFYYHFAFLIPPQTINLAIQFLEDKSIKLLPYKGQKIIEFTTGRAIYFFDQDNNIVEFIERPTLKYSSATYFSIASVIKVNEIGLPVEKPIPTAQEMMAALGIVPINKNEFRENFCWLGDFNGVIIVVKEGRHWLPTKIPGIINDFSLRFAENGEDKTVKFKNNKWKLNQF